MQHVMIKPGICITQTGRMYTVDGHIIVSRVKDNGDIEFRDISRRITGTIRGVELPRNVHPALLGQVVMCHYDAGAYESALYYEDREELEDIAYDYLVSIDCN